MDRKQFLIKFWDNVLKPISFVLTLVFAILNYSKVLEISKFFGMLVLITLFLFSVMGIIKFFIDSIKNLIPENIKRPINFFLKDFEKLLYLFPVAMIIFLIINWNNKTLGEKLFFIGLILLNIYEVYYKKKSEATNDQI